MRGEFPVREILDPPAAAVVETVAERVERVGGERGQQGWRDIRAGLERLRTLWKAIDRYPRLRDSQTLGSRRRDLGTLLARFSQAEPYTVEAYLPTRASLARAYGVARFNFFRMLGYVAEETLGGEPGAEELIAEVRWRGQQKAAALIAEDVLRSVACDRDHALELRRRATEILAALWDQRATRSLADFAPLLNSAWKAKTEVEICYGTLAGVSEMMQLVAGGLDERFVDCFAGDQVDEDRRAAFEEFLFNATFEELSRMREFMKESGRDSLDAEEVARLFGVETSRLHRTTVKADDMFFTFREREMWARMRRLRDLRGPKKTAEEYVMIFVLEQAGREPVNE